MKSRLFILLGTLGLSLLAGAISLLASDQNMVACFLSGSTYTKCIHPVAHLDTTAPLAGGADVAGLMDISISQASTAMDGYLSAADYTRFNNAGATIGAPVSGASANVVLFTDAMAKLAQDPANFIWDPIGLRLGIGTNAPAANLDINAAIPGSFTIHNGGTTFLAISSSGIGGFDPRLRIINTANSAAMDLYGSGTIDSTGDLHLFAAGVERMTVSMTGGNVGIGSLTPAAKLDVNGTAKLGAAGIAITAMGACSVGSSTPSTTPANLTCTGIPASTAVAVTCTAGAAFSTPAGDALYCRATGTADQIACNTVVANVTAVTLACSWVKP